LIKISGDHRERRGVFDRPAGGVGFGGVTNQKEFIF